MTRSGHADFLSVLERHDGGDGPATAKDDRFLVAVNVDAGKSRHAIDILSDARPQRCLDFGEEAAVGIGVHASRMACLNVSGQRTGGNPDPRNQTHTRDSSLANGRNIIKSGN